MQPNRLKSLVDRLNPTCRAALDEAGRLGVARTNYDIENEHWVTCLMATSNSDINLILRHYSVSSEAFHHDLMRVLNGLKTGNTRTPGLSPHMVSLIRDAWMICSLDFGGSQIRSGHVLMAILRDPRNHGLPASTLVKIEHEDLFQRLNDIGKNSVEHGTENSLGGGGGSSSSGGGGDDQVFSGNKALDKFTIDLTQQARDGKIDPIVGRDEEIRQLIDILCRRRQNNPILTGEAGVGKTAVVEGFARRIAEGDVPPMLKDVSLRSLDLSLLQAGAGVRGEFENRLKGVIEEVKGSPNPIIMFIDEAHNLVGAGGQAGQGDAANLLKPALARGELRTVAATTWAEYKKYFEEDAALSRRFQVVKVDEPDEPSTVQMIRCLTSTLEQHHNIRIRNDAVIDSVRLSNRYITGRQLPDKAVSVIDTACAKINLSQNATPPKIEDVQRKMSLLETEKVSLAKESVGAIDHSKRLAAIDVTKAECETELATLTERWEKEKEMVVRIGELYQQYGELEAGTFEAAEGETAPTSDETEKQIESLENQLAEIQQGEPLVHACCDKEAIAETVSSWTGIPLGRMVSDEIANILQLEDQLKERVIGQDHALNLISETIKYSRANLADPDKPIGVFMLAGTSGTGKTETALSLAHLLFGSDQNITTINMSEFKESHTGSSLTGPPPGYVGYGKGGILTEAVRQKPYSVILLDEMEKSHKEVQEMFFQVFDKGQMTDGTGRVVNFRNSIILMTSNAGTELISSLCADPETAPAPEVICETLHEEFLRQDIFKPAFLGRITLVPYYPLSDVVIQKIAVLKLNKVKKRIESGYQAEVEIDEAVSKEIAARCKEVASGARNIDKIVNQSLLPELSAGILQRMADNEPVTKVTIGIDDAKKFAITVV
ncbi:MAG: type VI secretion system ATPase TssH [Mariniblastus sp.]